MHTLRFGAAEKICRVLSTLLLLWLHMRPLWLSGVCCVCRGSDLLFVGKLLETSPVLIVVAAVNL